jgi:hypothetical protein
MGFYNIIIKDNVNSCLSIGFVWEVRTNQKFYERGINFPGRSDRER